MARIHCRKVFFSRKRSLLGGSPPTALILRERERMRERRYYTQYDGHYKDNRDRNKAATVHIVDWGVGGGLVSCWSKQ